MAQIYKLIEGATEELKERMTDVLWWEEYDVSTHIHEVADSRVPIYTGDILDTALSDIGLAVNEPELWPAFDGTPTPINIIAANIYEKLIEKLNEYVEGCGAL